MRRILLSSVFLLTLALPVSAGKADVFKSVRPLQTLQLNEEDAEISVTVLSTFCTTWPVRLGDGRLGWVTAGHCVVNDETQEPIVADDYFLIDKRPAHLSHLDLKNDIALLLGGPSAQPLQIALSAPAVLTPLITGGYPFGSKTLHIAQGVFMAPHDDDGPALYNLAAAPGMSGAPVIELSSGVVVGLIQTVECFSRGGWCPVSRGIPTDTLREFLGLN